jgi:transcriptional regulator with XRE-family HTH domain/quercetin dioxygenase-like cupin family protein
MPEKFDQNPAAIGKKLLTVRQDKKMSLRDLAAAAEISASMLSQIETGKAYPSVRSLYKIAAALGVSLDYFFPSEEEKEHEPREVSVIEAAELTASELREAMVNGGSEVAGFATDLKASPIVTRRTRPMIELQSGITWERLTGGAEPGAEFLEVVYQPQAHSGQTMSRHEGREFGLILEGELQVELAFETHFLKAGDSIIFDSNTPHRLSNATDNIVRALWVVLSPH